MAVQGSTNGSTFTNIVGSANYEFNPSVAGNSVTIDVASTSTRYVRLNVMSNTGWPAAQLSEFEIYGASGPIATQLHRLPALMKLNLLHCLEELK